MNAYKDLSNGHILYEIQTKYALITCELDPQHIKQVMATAFADFFNKAVTGKWSDAPPDFDFPRIKFKPEFDPLNASDEQIQKEFEQYIQHAWDLFREHFHSRLHETPALFITEVLIATVAKLASEGLFQPIINVSDLFDELIRIHASQIKNLWNAPSPGGQVIWTQERQEAFLDEYNATLEEALNARKSYPKDRKGKVAPQKFKEWIEDIKQQYRKIPEDKILLIVSRSWRSIVFDIVIERFAITSEAYAYKILRSAVRENKKP